MSPWRMIGERREKQAAQRALQLPLKAASD